MSKFNQGDRVKIVKLTDVDDKTSVITEPDSSDPFNFVGMIGTIVEPSMCDYYECTVELDPPWHNDIMKAYSDNPNNGTPPILAMLYCDLEVIK